MFKSKIGIGVILLILLSVDIHGMDKTDDISVKLKNGIETSPLMPVFNIYGIRYSRYLWDYGNILVGFVYQHWIWKDQGQANGPTITIGYRQFIREGLHLEYELWIAYNDFYSYVDNNYHPGYDFWHAIRSGYQFDFKTFDINWYMLLQFEIGYGIARINPWPEMKNKLSLNPLLLIGIKF